MNLWQVVLLHNGCNSLSFSVTLIFFLSRNEVCVLFPWICVGLWLWQLLLCDLWLVIQILPGSFETLRELSYHAMRMPMTHGEPCVGRCSGWQPASATRHVSKEALRLRHLCRQLAAAMWAILNKSHPSEFNQAQKHKNDNEISVIWSH